MRDVTDYRTIANRDAVWLFPTQTHPRVNIRREVAVEVETKEGPVPKAQEAVSGFSRDAISPGLTGVVTARGLADSLGITPQAGTRALRTLMAAGVARETIGRAA
jgi:hypothetical protein